MDLTHMTKSHAVHLTIGLRLIDRDLPTIPATALRKMRKGAQAVGLAVNCTNNVSEIVAAVEAIGFERSGIEPFLHTCLDTCLVYEPDQTYGMKPPPPSLIELYAAALENLE